MKINKQIQKKRIVLLFPILFLCCAVMLSTALNRLPFIEGTRIFAYQVLCMLLPGLALLRLIGYATEHPLEEVGMAYAIGYSISILTYIFAIPFKAFFEKWMSLIPILSYVVALLSAVYLLIDKRRRADDGMNKQTVREMIYFSVTLLALFVLYFLAFGIPNRLPPPDGEQAYYSDTLYWIGNAVSLSRSFPPESMRGVGHTIYYHYFSSMQLVAMEKTTGVNVVSLALGYSYIESVMLLAFGLFNLFNYLFDRKWKVAVGILLVVFSCGYTQMTASYYTSHVLTQPFGFDLATGLTAAGIIVLLKMYQAKELKGSCIGVFLLLLMATIGTKAPLGIQLLGFTGLLCFYWLFTHKKVLRVVCFGALALCAFAFVYFSFMSQSLTSWIEQAAESSAVETAATTKAFDISWQGTSQYASVLHEWYFPENQAMALGWRVLLCIKLMIEYCFYIHMALIFLDFCAGMRMLLHPRENDAIQWICIILIILSLLLTLFIAMSGYSQIYFVESSILLMTILALYRTKRQPHLSPEIKRVKWSVASVLIAVCVLNAWTFTYGFVKDAFVTMKTGKASITNELRAGIISNIVTPLEAQGYEWIRENTDEDAILITNATVNETGPLKTSVFSGRRIYVESNAAPSVSRAEADKRIEQIRQFYDGEIVGYNDLIENGVDYAIVLTRYETGEEYTRNLPCVYQNEDIRIYKLMV